MIKQKRSNGLMFHFQPRVGMVGITLGAGMGVLCSCLGGALLGGMGGVVGSWIPHANGHWQSR